MEITTYLYILLAVIIALAIAAFQYFYKSKSRSKTTVFLAFLRFLALFSLLLLVINPTIESQLLETVKPKLLVAIDNSSSIKFLKNDVQVNETLQTIKEDNDLNKKFDVNYFAFAEETKELDTLGFKSNNTNILNTISSLDNLNKDKNASVIVITDGNQTLGTDYSFYRSKSTIFPIAVGDTIPQEDLKISKLNVNRYSFLNNTFPVEAFINYNGKNTISTNLTVVQGNSTVYRKTVTFSQNKNSEKVNFNLTANRVGALNYRISVSSFPNEFNTINNRKNFVVDVIDEQSKIALVSDFIHPDIGMLKRSIETNKQRKVDILTAESAINLKDYQLIILYQPNRGFKNIFERLVENSSNYFIISGNQTDWNFLNNIQTDFSKSTINQSEDYQAAINTSYSSFALDDLNFNDFPPLQAKFGEIRFNLPYEAILYQNVNGIQINNPLLATFSDKNRRGAILLGENSWKWRAFSYTQNKSFTDFDGFINKLVQYLSLKKKLNRLELNYLPVVYQNDVIKIEATYFNSNYEVDTRANLSLSLVNKQNKSVKIFPFRLNGQYYEANIPNLSSGDYNFTVDVEGQNMQRGGSFTVLDYNIEQQFTYTNMTSLNSLASNSNGKLYHFTNYKNLLENLKTSNNYKPIQKSASRQSQLINWKWLLGLVVLFLSLEWFIRKYYGKI